MKLRNVTATKVGTITLIRLMRKRSIQCPGRHPSS
jgi:hypothetical protein